VHIGKRLKFLADLTRNTDIDGDTIKIIIRHYLENIDEKLVIECRQFKECIRLVNTHENMKYPEILQLICRGADKSLARPTSRCILFDG
jgi:hypothetical protein